jgi:hypothetical protein
LYLGLDFGSETGGSVIVSGLYPSGQGIAFVKRMGLVRLRTRKVYPRFLRSAAE